MSGAGLPPTGPRRASSPVKSNLALLPGTRAWRLKRRYKALTRRPSSKDAYAPFRRLVLKLAGERGVAFSVRALREFDRALIRARKAPGDAIQLKLRNCSLSSPGICIIFEALASCPAVDKLDLRGNSKGLDAQAINSAAELMCRQITSLLSGPLDLEQIFLAREKNEDKEFTRRLHGILADTRVERSCCLRRIKLDRNVPGRIRLQQLETLAIRANERLAIRQSYLICAARLGGLDSSLGICIFQDETSALTAAIEALELCIADPKLIDTHTLSTLRRSGFDANNMRTESIGSNIIHFEKAIYRILQNTNSLLGPPTAEDLALLKPIIDQYATHENRTFSRLWPVDLDGDRGAASPLNARSESAFDDDDDEVFSRRGLDDDQFSPELEHQPSLNSLSVAEVKDDVDEIKSQQEETDNFEDNNSILDDDELKAEDEEGDDSDEKEELSSSSRHFPSVEESDNDFIKEEELVNENQSVLSIHSDCSRNIRFPNRLPAKQTFSRIQQDDDGFEHEAHAICLSPRDSRDEEELNDFRRKVQPVNTFKMKTEQKEFTDRDSRTTHLQSWNDEIPSSPRLESELGSDDDDVLSRPKKEHPMALAPFRLTPKTLRDSTSGLERQSQFEAAADALATHELEPPYEENSSKQMIPSSWNGASSMASSGESVAIIDLSQRAVTCGTLLQDLDASLLASGDQYSRLQRLVLSKNRLQWLPLDVILKLDCLKVLDVSHNELSSLRPASVNQEAHMNSSLNQNGSTSTALASVELTPTQLFLTSSRLSNNEDLNKKRLATTRCSSTKEATLPASLVHIDASYNRLCGLGGLEACGRLRVLRVRHNRLRHLGGLEHLNLLQEIDAAYNAIVKASILRPLSCNTELLSLNVTGCPLDANPARPARPKLVCLLPHLHQLNGEPMPRSAQSELERRRSIERREQQQLETNLLVSSMITPRAAPELVRSQRKSDAERSDYGRELNTKRRLIAVAKKEEEKDPRLLTTKQQAAKARQRKKQLMNNSKHVCAPTGMRTAAQQRETMELLCKECAKPARKKVPIVDVPRVFGQPLTGLTEPSRRASEPWRTNGTAINAQSRRRSTSAHRGPPNTVIDAKAPRRRLVIVAKEPPDQFESWLDELLRVLTAAKNAVEVLEKLKKRKPSFTNKFRGFGEDNEGIQDKGNEDDSIFSDDIVHPFRQSLADVEAFATRPPPESALEACVSAPGQLRMAAMAWNDARQLSGHLRDLLTFLFPEPRTHDGDDHKPQTADSFVAPDTSMTKGSKPTKSSKSQDHGSTSLGSAFKEEVEEGMIDSKHPLANFADRLEFEIGQIKSDQQYKKKSEKSFIDKEEIKKYSGSNNIQPISQAKPVVKPSVTMSIPNDDHHEASFQSNSAEEASIDESTVQETVTVHSQKKSAVRRLFEKFRSAPASNLSSVDYTLEPLSSNGAQTERENSVLSDPLSQKSELIEDLKNVNGPATETDSSTSEESSDEELDQISDSPIWRQGYDKTHMALYFNDMTGESIWVKPPNNAPFVPYDPHDTASSCDNADDIDDDVEE